MTNESCSGPQDLDAQLTPRTYIVDNVLTPADVAVYGALHPTIVRPGEAWLSSELISIIRCSLNGSRPNTTPTPP